MIPFSQALWRPLTCSCHFSLTAGTLSARALWLSREGDSVFSLRQLRHSRSLPKSSDSDLDASAAPYNCRSYNQDGTWLTGRGACGMVTPAEGQGASREGGLPTPPRTPHSLKRMNCLFLEFVRLLCGRPRVAGDEVKPERGQGVWGEEGAWRQAAPPLGLPGSRG